MPHPTSDLAVRLHERYACELPAHVSVSASSAAGVRLARSTVGATGKIPARVVDCSLGGVGIQSSVFFPMTCCMNLWLTVPGSSGNAGRDIELEVRLQRVTMLDRKPTYYLGGSFESEGPDAQAAIARLLGWLKATGAPLVPEKSRA